MRILLAGGGSGGPATPILAVVEELRRRVPTLEALYIGTHDGPEAALAAEDGIPYVGIAAGKLRRYWDTKNVTDVGRVALGGAESLGHVRRFRPHVALGAGGFASVPPLYAAKLLGVPFLTHQPDVVPGLANRLLMPFAARISVTFPTTLRAFPARRTVLRGNPVRRRIFEADPADAYRQLGLDPAVPLVVVTGGGTGALGLNRIVAEAAPRLIEHCQILHLTGRGRGVPVPDLGPRYQQREFIVGEMPAALAAASIVVTRAGVSTLSELSALGKPALIVPIPDSHQGPNAMAFVRAGAALAVEQADLTPDVLTTTVVELLANDAHRESLSRAIAGVLPRDAAARIADDVLDLARARHRRRHRAR